MVTGPFSFFATELTENYKIETLFLQVSIVTDPLLISLYLNHIEPGIVLVTHADRIEWTAVRR